MHPLANFSKPASKYPPYTGDGSNRSIAQWSKQIPVKESVTLPDGKAIDVFNLRQRIAILSPSYGFQVTEFYMNALEAARGVSANYRMADGSIANLSIIGDRYNVPNDSHIDRARNTITNQWVNDDLYDWGYWWDVDVSAPPQFMMRLFVHGPGHGQKFVCGHYAMKDILPTFVANVRPGSTVDPETGLRELTDGGTGSMLWHRDVPLKLRTHPEVKPFPSAPNTPFSGQILWAYFSSGVYGPPTPWEVFKPEAIAALGDAATVASLKAKYPAGLPNWLSEDWKICRMWQDLGEKVFGDIQIKLQHYGGLNYPPTVEALVGATDHLIRHHHPAVAADKLRASLAAYKAAELPKAA